MKLNTRINAKIYWTTFKNSLILTYKNILAYVLFTVYIFIFYLGLYYYFEKQYIYSVLMFFIFSLCLSSIFYILGKIVNNGYFSFIDFIKSFKEYYFRANFVLIFWFAIFFFINQFIITPLSTFIKGYVLLYLVIVPFILLVFFAFNTLPEEIYSSKDNIESIFINSINFMERHWLVWILPNILIIFLYNIVDKRFTITPTLGYLDSESIIKKLHNYNFYVQTFIITIALIFRGLLYSELKLKKEN